MALIVKNMVVASKPVPIDYSSHLGDQVVKPVSGQVTIEKTVKKQTFGGVSQSDILVKGVIVPTNKHFMITVEGGRTMNLGNYESAKIGVSITVPCEPENLDVAYEFGSEWISAKIEEAVKQVKG